MLDQSLVRSGFDAEILFGERQFTAVLLALLDAGEIPISFSAKGQTITFRGPAQIDRTYEPHPDAPPLDPVPDNRRPFEVELLFDHPLGADIRVHVVVEAAQFPIEVDLFVALAPEIVRDDAGLVERARLAVTVVDFEIEGFDSIAALLETTKPELLADIKKEVDRTVDLGGVGTFNRIQDLATRKHPAEPGHPAAFGIYVNLRLQTGPEPETLMPTRGDPDAARNFLPEGSDAAMASRAGLYHDIAVDAFNRFAEIDENGNVSHPWRKSPFKKTSSAVGKILGVRVAPIPNSATLRIKVDAEREVENFVDPNGALIVELTPSTTADGTLRWHVNVDFQASVVLEVIGVLALSAIFTGVLVASGLGIGAAIAFGFMAGSVGDFAGHLIVDEWRSGRIEKKIDAGLPDVVSGRLEVAQRRWDPLYATHHQIAMRPDGALVNELGIALWGRAVLDRETVPVAHAVIRDKRMQSPSPPTHLRYQVSDAADFAEDYTAIAPGTDRRPFGQHDPLGEPTLFELEIDEVVERLAQRRIVPEIAYVPKRIDMRQNQVHSILVFARQEHGDARDAFIDDFASRKREEITTDDGAQLRDEIEDKLVADGSTPTPEQLDALVGAEIERRVEAAVQELLADPTLDAQVEFFLRGLLRFDLPPEYFAALQKKKILRLLGLEIITMRAPGHEGVMYYRDKPDFHVPDNLHSLPRYRATAAGPQML